MNTVDSLKKLYKTMAGKDWPYDPNPTDAEVIDKIAADAQSGGSGGDGIKIKAVMPAGMMDSSNPPVVESLEPELTVEQLTGAVLYMYMEVTSEPTQTPIKVLSTTFLATAVMQGGDSIIKLILNSGSAILTYDRVSGEITADFNN